MNQDKLFALAEQFQLKQDFAKAEYLCLVILHHLPDHVNALQLLGVLYAQQNDFLKAIPLLEKAAKLAPERSDILLNLAGTMQSIGEVQDALSLYLQILNNQADYLPAYLQLGELYRRQQDFEQAEFYLHHWLQHYPHDIASWNNFANILLAQSKYSQAQDAFQQALKLSPQHPVLLFNQANLFQKLGLFNQAISLYQKLLAIKPEHLDALCYISLAFSELKQFDLAASYLEQASQLFPSSPLPCLYKGHRYMALKETEMALEIYQESLKKDSCCLAAWINQGIAYQQLGEFRLAKNSFAKALELSPQNIGLQLRQTLIMPVFLEYSEQAQNLRESIIKDLDKLEAYVGKVSNPVEELGQTPFYLAYHDHNDLALYQKINSLYQKFSPSLNFSKPRSKRRSLKLKLGFISENLKYHTIGLLMGQILKQLSKDTFEISLFYFAKHCDVYTQGLINSVHSAIELPYDLNLAQNKVAQCDLDILFYTDVGIDNFTYYLAFSRLANVQCTTWGHPVSTGLSSMDYFFSSQMLETSSSHHYYSEELIRMDHMIPYYLKPQLDPALLIPLPLGNIYLCPQSLFKLHPDFDQALNDILEQDLQAQIIFLDGHRQHWQRLLIQRWQKMMREEFLSRIHFLPRLTRAEYLALLSQADVILDPFYFSGGNSSYEALSVGTPIITLPTDLLRGRITSALYQTINLNELLARTPTDFVGLALKLAQDKQYNQDIRRKILSSNEALFENHAAIDELSFYLLEIGALC